MEEIKEGRVSKSKNRRSSILKSRRLPLVDMDINSDKLDTENNFGKKSKKSLGKRVSFSEKLQINEFNQQPSYNECFKGPNELNMFRILADEAEPQMQLLQNKPGSAFQQNVFGELVQNKHRQKRKSFDIDSYIENYEASNSLEDDTDDSNESCSKNKSFYHCETIRFDDDDMEFTCKGSETTFEDSNLDNTSQADSYVEVLSKPVLQSQEKTTFCDKETDENIIRPKFGDVSNQEDSNGNKSIFESENWYREMLEKARLTCKSKARQYDASCTNEELELYPAQPYKAMSCDVNESQSVENAEPRVLNKNGYYWDSIIPRLKGEDSDRENKLCNCSKVLEGSSQAESRENLAAIASTGEGSAFHAPAAKKVKLQSDMKMESMNNELDENEALPLKEESSIYMSSFARNAGQNSFKEDKKIFSSMLTKDRPLSNTSQSFPENDAEQAKSELQSPAKIQNVESGEVHFSEYVLEQNDDFEVKVHSTAPSVEFNSSMHSRKVDVSNDERSKDSVVNFSKEIEDSFLHLKFKPSGTTNLKKQLATVVEYKEPDFVDVKDPAVCHSRTTQESDCLEEKRQCPEFETEATQSFVSQTEEPKGGTKDALSPREVISLFPDVPNEEPTIDHLHAKEKIHITIPDVSSHVTSTQPAIFQESHHNEYLQELNAFAGKREALKESERFCMIEEDHKEARDKEFIRSMSQKNSFDQEELGPHEVSSSVLQKEADYDCGNSPPSLHISQHVLESKSTPAVLSDVPQTAEEEKITTSDKQTVVEGTQTCGRADVGGSGRLELSDIRKKMLMTSTVKVNETYDVFPESDFNRRRSETFYVPKRDSNAFTKNCNDREDNWLVKGGKEPTKAFSSRRETFVFPKPLFNASPAVEGLGKSRLSIGNIKKKAKDRMSWISREQMIVASTPVHPMRKQDINDILEVEEKSSSCLEVTSLEKTVNVNGIDKTLTNDQNIVKDSDEKDDGENCDEKETSMSGSNEKDDIISNGSLSEEVNLDQQKDEDEKTIRNEPANNEDNQIFIENGLEEMMRNVSNDERLQEFAKVDEDNFNLPLEEDHFEHQARVALWKRQNLELESQLAELRKNLNEKQKERVAADQILVAAKEERKERDKRSHERKLKEQKLKETHKVESCDNVNNDELGREHKINMEMEHEAAASRNVIDEEDALKRKEEQDEEIRMIANHAQKQLLPWYLSTWSRSHFEFKLFRFHLTVEFEEMDENSLDFYNILKWDRNITQMKFGTSAKGCNERSEYVASRIFRHIRTDSLMERYKTTKSLKKLLEEVSKIIMAHRDLFEDLNSVYINKNLIYVDDNTLETEFFSGYGILYTEFRIRCSINEEEALPRLKLSFHHLSSIDRKAMFQPVIDSSTEGPMLFSRVVRNIDDIINEATRKYLNGKPSILTVV